ncbi:MAG: carboxypeptidase regulatory-like domain-containing protein, partial [Gemmatimonadota bacterium]|nr:carboxypeptidase regulatory-like domain-containing protein [Gemmatimonadota bacterium]
MMHRTLLVVIAIAVTHVGAEAQATAARYERTCDGGDLVACTVVGLIYQTGAGGVQDLARATDLYRGSCDRGVMVACTWLEFVEDGGSATATDNERGRVGYVADAYDGTPLRGAIVLVRGVAGVGELRYLTDAVGRVAIDQLPRGRHPIEVRHGGYQRTEGELPVPWQTDFLILVERLVTEEDSQVGQIFGQVTEEGTTDGIADVDITVRGGSTVRTISNRQGRFQLSGLEPGRVVVEFQRVGFETRRTMLTVQRGRTS